ncbi:MAG TPA: GNAT family protein [Patescibacteria group bacterium]|nr:GNAT family protein [Patescibacteria group bacterium]
MYEGNFAGLIGFNNVDWERKCTSFGYWLGESFQGKGIMTKALETFINYAFSTMHLNKIEIPIAEENNRSRALLESFGFQVEGIIRDAEWLYDRYVNHVMYGLLKHEWSARQ